MSVEVVCRLLTKSPNVSSIKEETLNASQMMTAIMTKAGKARRGILGGVGGRYLLDKDRRGGCDTMPACQTTDGQTAICNAREPGSGFVSRRIVNRLRPFFNMEGRYTVDLYGEVLKRRGVIAHATVRGRVSPTPDEYDHKELDAALADVSEFSTARRMGRVEFNPRPPVAVRF